MHLPFADIALPSRNPHAACLVANPCYTYTPSIRHAGMLMYRTLVVVPLLLATGWVHAQSVNCSAASMPQAVPLRPTVLAPITFELTAPSSQLGAPSGVLSQAYDEAQSVDQVLLRLRIEGCQNVAKAIPAPSALDPNDPAAYKPKTEFDNTPWRFDMSQNGKRMTADEFDAWMKARGVRVVGRNPVAPAAATPAVPVDASAQAMPSATLPVVPTPVPAALPAPQTKLPQTVPVVPALPPGSPPAQKPKEG